jgi:ribosomal protein S18 acetylase RimI-like enzyme
VGSPRPDVALRPIAPEDEELLCRVYASTRAEELAPLAWTEEEKAAFLRMQFAAQHRYYQENYASSRFDLVLVDGRPAGRLYVASWPGEVRVVDIALLPEFRRRGVGTALLRALLDEGAERGVPVRIHVERQNPALALYERLGFRLLEDRGVYLFLEWRAGAPGPADAARPEPA